MPSHRFDGSPIKAARESHDPPLTQAQAARRAGISHPHWSLIELGYRQPPIETLASVCKTVGISVDDCFVDDAAGAARRTVAENDLESAVGK
jgi:transcriptional regulator with XRE-family HTH domain